MDVLIKSNSLLLIAEVMIYWYNSCCTSVWQLLSFASRSSSPQLPTLADCGITQDTLDRLPLLKLAVEQHNSYMSVSQRSVFW